MYIERHLEETIKNVSNMFGAVLVTGARQVGKTTLLKQATNNIPYITLDDPIMLRFAKDESGTFFKNNEPPIFLDEVQYAPDLFPYIKMIIDKEQRKGLFYLSGSQKFVMMKNVSESLAGRLAILELLGLSLREINKINFNIPFVPTDDYFAQRKKHLRDTSYKDIWGIIHKGCMPQMYRDDKTDWKMFYASYTKTYIERDVRDITQVENETKFLKFMTAMAARTSNLLNLSSVANEVGISIPTAERWLSILRASNIVYLLQPYYNNIAKRTIKTPKLYFLDTGLAAYLTQWNTPEVLESGAMAGAFFETFVITEILKSYYNKGDSNPPIYFYRDKEKNEIDLLISQDGILYPIEIKKHADPSKRDVSGFDVIGEIGGDMKRGSGGVICMYDNLIPLKGDDKAIPLGYI